MSLNTKKLLFKKFESSWEPDWKREKREWLETKFGALNTNIIKEFVGLELEEIEINKQLKAIEDRKNKLDPIIQENLATEGIKNIKILGRTVYLHNAPYVQVVGGKDAAIEAVKNSDLKWLIKKTEGYNTTSLKAALAEMKRENRPVPKEFEGVIKLEDKYRVKTKKAA